MNNNHTGTKVSAKFPMAVFAALYLEKEKKSKYTEISNAYEIVEIIKIKYV
jgi:hypothetical protein